MSTSIISVISVLFFIWLSYVDVSDGAKHIASTDNATFFLDENHKVSVLKTSTGCYVVHLNHDQMDMLNAPDTLYTLETAIKDQVEVATSFHSLHQSHISSYSQHIVEGCKNTEVFTIHVHTDIHHG